MVGERLDALIIGVIVAASVGLGFTNEYRAERAAEATPTASNASPRSSHHRDLPWTRRGPRR